MSTDRFTQNCAAAAAVAIASVAGSAHAGFLTGTSYYTSAVASSQFSAAYGINNIFDSNMSTQCPHRAVGARGADDRISARGAGGIRRRP